MPWPTYSERFLHHTAKGPWYYTVPAKHRAVVTSCLIVTSGGVAGWCVVAIGAIYICYADFLPNPGVYDREYRNHLYEMRAVAYQGEQISSAASIDGIHLTVSGYLLEDNTGRTGPPAGAATLPALPEIPLPEDPRPLPA